MKKVLFVLLAVCAMAGFALAQITTTSDDVLGAHLNYGRGCAACHAPHSGVYGNGGAKTAYANAGVHALWGQDLGSLVGQTIQFGDSTGGWTETLPDLTATTPDRNVTECLSCHDGNLAKGAMMKNAVYETLPSTYGTYNTIPTLLGQDGTSAGNYLNDHPVGLNAEISCGGTYDWDCTIVNGVITYPAGTNMAKFVTNYGWFVSPGNYNGKPVVTCTTCHHQHVMNISKVTNGSKSGLPSGNYATMFFVRGPYNPANVGPTSNQTAQFCRQCHGGEANEMNSSTAGTTF
jgi:nitrate/TMAO reductase-like tetraheme cytochrome c subunit